jgi:hypothetical protein
MLNGADLVAMGGLYHESYDVLVAVIGADYAPASIYLLATA